MTDNNEANKETLLKIELEYGDYDTRLEDKRLLIPHNDITRGQIIDALDNLVHFITHGKLK